MNYLDTQRYYDPKINKDGDRVPLCVICNRPLKKGSLLDHFWPYYDDKCYHKVCLKEKSLTKED